MEIYENDGYLRGQEVYITAPEIHLVIEDSFAWANGKGISQQTANKPCQGTSWHVFTSTTFTDSKENRAQYYKGMWTPQAVAWCIEKTQLTSPATEAVVHGDTKRCTHAERANPFQENTMER